MSLVKDNIPRLHQLVEHVRDQLTGLREGGTFEQIRLSYAGTVERLAAEGLGRRTASRVDDREAYWSPAAEFLQEAMRLGLVQRQPLPSARRYLESYREKRFELTAAGRELESSSQTDPGAFFDRLARAVIDNHPYLTQFLLLLNDAPLVCPELSEGAIEAGRRDGRRTEYWAQWAADRINAGPSGAVVNVKAVAKEMGTVVHRRFGQNPAAKPASKALSEALNDAFATASIRARGVPMGALELKILRAWGSQLRLLDQSRHVPQFEGSNLLWIAADVHRAPTGIEVKRRGIREYGACAARSVVAAYRNQSAAGESNLAAPYLPIFSVRAEAAFACRVTRALVDLVLDRLSNGEYPELGVKLWLHLGRGDQAPPSEPVYRRGGMRRYQITIQQKGA